MINNDQQCDTVNVSFKALVTMAKIERELKKERKALIPRLFTMFILICIVNWRNRIQIRRDVCELKKANVSISSDYANFHSFERF